MVEVIWTASALQDLSDIGEFISRDSTRYAELTVFELFTYTDILEAHPLSGKKTEDFNDSSIRQLIKGSYRVVYKIISKDRIDVLTVHNCARLISNTKYFRSKK